MTVRPTIMADIAVSAVLGAAQWNVNALQQARWTQEVLAGTNADKIPGSALSTTLTLPGTLNLNNDANFGFSFTSGPIYTADSADLLTYDRAGNNWRFYIGNVLVWQMDGGGTMTGAGFYDSGAAGVTITNGSTAVFSHGFGVQPRFVFGVRGAAAGSMALPIVPQQGATTEVRFTDISTTITVANNLGSTQVCRVYAFK